MQNEEVKVGWAKQFDFCIEGGWQGGGGQHNTPTFTILFFMDIS